MANVFDSPRAILHRAEHHINDFEAALSTFVSEKPWSYIVDDQSQPGKNIHKIHFEGEGVGLLEKGVGMHPA